MIQIKIETDGYEWLAVNFTKDMPTGRIGTGSTIQEAIEDFLKINKLQNVKYTWR